MKSIFIVLALFVSLSVSFDIEDYTWAGFKRIHNRSYAGEEERMREIIFEENLQFIKDFNEQGHSYSLGVNQFADLTNLEYRRMVLGYDNEARLNKKFESKKHVCRMNTGKLPDSVDWRGSGIVTAIKDQKQCGSCWAFSAVGSLEGQYAQNISKLISLSEQQFVDCSRAEGNQGCQGGLMVNAYKYVETKKEEKESDYPYTAENGECKVDKSKGIFSITNYRVIKQKDIAALKDAVANVGPISVAMDASHSSFQFYKDGIYDPIFCSEFNLDHGVLIVGYGSEHNKDYWIVKNSWGTVWGEKGYFEMAVKDNKCGIATSASYPVM